MSVDIMDRIDVETGDILLFPTLAEQSLTEAETSELTACEIVIKRGLEIFAEVGEALFRVRDGRLYRAEFTTFESYCAERWHLKARRAYQLIETSLVAYNVQNFAHPIQTESHAAALLPLTPELQRAAWKQAVETAPEGKITAAHVASVVEEFKAEKPHVSYNSGQNEWYTPSELIEAARRTMGFISLDPASSEIANQIVQAAAYYTVEDNGLIPDWYGNVWLNPPYSQPEIGHFADKVAKECNNYERDKPVHQICILVNNATDTAWFHTLLDVADAICLLRGRVKFLDTDLQPTGAPLQGQVVLYHGNNVSDFHEQFAPFGKVMSIEY